MALPITDRAEREAQKLKIEPQLVLEIEGVPTRFGAVEITKLVRVGETGLVIGNDWKIGGLVPLENQEDLLSFEGGGARIDQQLYPDKGAASSVSSLQLTLNDRDLLVTKIISPGVVIDDVLGAKATVWAGFKGTAFKDDFTPIFSGIIDDIESAPGQVKINIAHPEQLKRQEIFTPVDVELAESIDSVQTTVPLIDASLLPRPVNGPDGSPDPAIRYYVKIEDEFIRYTGISGNSLTGCTRAALASGAAVHTVTVDEPKTGKSCLSIEDTAVYCALKIMLSGVNGYWKSGVAISDYLNVDPYTTVDNAVFFDRVDLNRDFGVTEGDYVTITGASNGANNCTMKRIQSLTTTEDGSYIVIDGVTFVAEPDTAATISFRSQFDTLGIGLGMTPDQVDVAEHVFWHNFQLASMSYRFVIQKQINGKAFLDTEVYLPIGAFSIPRQGRASMGYHVGPVVRGELKTLDEHTIKDPHKIRLRRATSRNFYNTIAFQFDQNAGTEKFNSGVVMYSAESKNRIKVGNKVMTVASSGLRHDLDGAGIAQRVASRYLGRYKWAAEFFENIGVLFRDGYTIEPGDPVMLDVSALNVSNIEDGTRVKRPKLFTVTNKRMDLKTGDVTVALVDSNFDETERYGSVAPSSIVIGGTTTSLKITDSFGAYYPGNESRKWAEYVGLPIRVHSPDFTFDETVTLAWIDDGDRYRLLIDPATPLSAPPAADYVVEIDQYPLGVEPKENARYKAVHSFISPVVGMIAAMDTAVVIADYAPGILDCFAVGKTVKVFDPITSNESKFVTIIDRVQSEIDGTYLLSFDQSIGFTPGGYSTIQGNFNDGGKPYLIL